MENVHCYDLFTDRWWRAVFSVSQGLCVPDYRMCIAVSSLHNSSFIQWDTQHIIISEMCTVTLIPNAQCTIVGSQIYSPIHLLFVFIHFTSVIFIIKANTMIIKAEKFPSFYEVTYWFLVFYWYIVSVLGDWATYVTYYTYFFVLWKYILYFHFKLKITIQMKPVSE